MLGKTVLRFEVKAGPTGSLFGSVTPTDIADEIWRTRKVRVDRRKIELPSRSSASAATRCRSRSSRTSTVDVKTLVVPEGGELPPEEELEAMAAAEAAAERPPSGGEESGQRSSPRTSSRATAVRAERRADGVDPEAAERRRGRAARAPEPPHPPGTCKVPRPRVFHS